MQVANVREGARAAHAAAAADGDATMLRILPQDASANHSLIPVRVGSGHGSGGEPGETF